MLWLFVVFWIGLTIEEVLVLTFTHFTWSWINIWNAVWIFVLLPIEAVWLRYVSCKRRLLELIKKWSAFLTMHHWTKWDYWIATNDPRGYDHHKVAKVTDVTLQDKSIRKATWYMVFFLDPRRSFPSSLRLMLMGPDKWNHVEPWRRSQVSEALFKARHKSRYFGLEHLLEDSRRLFGDWYGIN